MKPPTDASPGLVAVPLKGAVLVISERVCVAGLKLGKTLRAGRRRRRGVPRRWSAPMRTFQSEARRMIRQDGMAEPAVDRLGDSLCWILFASGQLKRRRRGHGNKAWHQRTFVGGTYEPPTR